MYKIICTDSSNGNCCEFKINFKPLLFGRPAFCPNCGSDEYTQYLGKEETNE